MFIKFDKTRSTRGNNPNVSKVVLSVVNSRMTRLNRECESETVSITCAMKPRF